MKLQLLLSTVLPAAAFLVILVLFLKKKFRWFASVQEQKADIEAGFELVKEYNENLLRLLSLTANEKVWDMLKDQTSREIILFGYNPIAELILNIFEKNGQTIRYIIDNNKSQKKTVKPGIQCIDNRKFIEIAGKMKGTGITVLVCILHCRAYQAGASLMSLLENTGIRDSVKPEYLEKMIWRNER